MPKKKLDPAQLAEMFKEFDQSDVATMWRNLLGLKKKAQQIELGSKDINDRFEQFFEKMFEFGALLKVPGRKAKSYDQEYIRTMFFLRAEEIQIDGVKYPITNSTNVENYTDRIQFLEFYNLLDEINDMDENSFMLYKKNITGALKEWDKRYMKHIKGAHPEIQEIIKSGMTPMTKVMDSNYNF